MEGEAQNFKKRVLKLNGTDNKLIIIPIFKDKPNEIIRMRASGWGCSF